MRALMLTLLACSGPLTEPPKTEADADTDTDADADADADTDTDTDADTDPPTIEAYTDGTSTTTVTVENADTLTATYSFTTDHPQRDGGPTAVTVIETDTQPVLRSGSVLFDGLFALAVQEARENSVSAVTDGAFANGTPVPCDCFQTGELWSWVWTRDTAYATDLGLAWLDPQRSADSLRFKLSRPKDGGSLQIVQDTGSGGSWPVSTDRAIWALGAQSVLDALTGIEREAFLAEALEAVAETARIDRASVHDPSDGLYRGEQSFLDWREQSYSTFTAFDVVPITESKALSTNLAHWILLDAASRWSDAQGATADRDLFRDWADQLETAIQQHFAQGDAWRTLVGPPLDPSVPKRRDLLGEALAGLTIATPQQAISALSSYPHGPHGPPVIWPQQAGVPVYHNRAQWPFVTAYGLRVAGRTHNAAVFDAGADELIRGAALNLSNMENAEWTTGEPWFDDGALSGPIVNSRRQLWSVAGYLSLVVDGLFGVRPASDGLTFDPFVTDALRQTWLDDTVVLHRFPWHGELLDLTLELPSGPGPMGSGTSTETPTGFTLSPVAVSAQGSRTDADPSQSDTHTAPPEPELQLLTGEQAGVTLSWTPPAGADIAVFRDGVLVEANAGSPWTDPDTTGIAGVSWCYALEARFSDVVSTHSAPQCWWGDGEERVQIVDAYGFVAADGTWSTDNGFAHYQDWGAPDHALTVRFRPGWTGPHGLQWSYANGAGGLTTGLTASHKWFTLTNAGGTVAEGPVVLPHTGGWDVWRDSTLARVDLEGDTTYTLTLTDAPNMTDLEAMRDFTAGPGGGPTPYRDVDIAALKLLAFDGVDQRPPVNALGFDGVDDLAALPPDQVVTPGVALQPWASFGLEWDESHLYLAVVSEAFEDPFVPFVLYLEADPGTATPGAGLSYSGQVPDLPFTPSHAITLRREHDALDGLGPWSGIRRYTGSDWELQMRLLDGRDVWAAADQHTLAVRIPRHQLGDPSTLRIAGHIVYAQPGHEWKATVPSAHTPWDGGGASWNIDLSGPHSATDW